MNPKDIYNRTVSDVPHDIVTITSMLQENSSCIRGIYEYVAKLGFNVANFDIPSVNLDDYECPSMRDVLKEQSKYLAVIRDMLHDITEVLG